MRSEGQDRRRDAWSYALSGALHLAAALLFIGVSGAAGDETASGDAPSAHAAPFLVTVTRRAPPRARRIAAIRAAPPPKAAEVARPVRRAPAVVARRPAPAVAAGPRAVASIATERPAPAASELPTAEPTASPTAVPTIVPTERPSPRPTEPPTPSPTEPPTPAPTVRPTPAPTVRPTPVPVPTERPTVAPTERPTPVPIPPTARPTVAPSAAPARTALPERAVAVLPAPVAHAPAGEPSARFSAGVAVGAATPAAEQRRAADILNERLKALTLAAQLPNANVTYSQRRYVLDVGDVERAVEAEWEGKLAPPASVLAHVFGVVYKRTTLTAPASATYLFKRSTMAGVPYCVGWMVIEHPLGGGEPETGYAVIAPCGPSAYQPVTPGSLPFPSPSPPARPQAAASEKP